MVRELSHEDGVSTLSNVNLDKTVADDTLNDNSTSNEKVRKIDFAKVRKNLRQLLLVAMYACVGSFMGTTLFREIQSMNMKFDALESSVNKGEFDPTMGEKITSQNKRALVVVHEGFGQEVMPLSYEHNEEYQEYLRKLQAEKELYYENGDPVVIVITDVTLANHNFDLTPKENTLYFVTEPNNGHGVVSFVTSDGYYNQNLGGDWETSQSVWEILKSAGVEVVEMAGEFRGACPSQVAETINAQGIKIGWCDNCAYPAISDAESLKSYPTLEPLQK